MMDFTGKLTENLAGVSFVKIEFQQLEVKKQN